MQELRQGPSPRLRTWGMVLLVLGATLACYWPALTGAMLWDDPGHVTRPDLRSGSGLVRIWTDIHATQQFYPVLHSAFWVEHRIWGDATIGYHLLNVLLHAASCCLLATLLRRLWSKPAGQTVPPGTEWLAALLFAVHGTAPGTVPVTYAPHPPRKYNTRVVDSRFASNALGAMLNPL